MSCLLQLIYTPVLYNKFADEYFIFQKTAENIWEQKIFEQPHICKKYLDRTAQGGWVISVCCHSALLQSRLVSVMFSLTRAIICCKNKTTTKFSSCATLCQFGLTSGSSLGLPRVRGRGGSVREKT